MLNGASLGDAVALALDPRQAVINGITGLAGYASYQAIGVPLKTYLEVKTAQVKQQVVEYNCGSAEEIKAQDPVEDVTPDVLDILESSGVTTKNWRGEEVKIPDDHIMSPRDPDFSTKPITEEGPYTSVQRDEFLKGNSAGTKISPHHRHQIPVRDGGIIDEIPGPGHPSGNILRIEEIKNHWIQKGNRLIEVEPGVWIVPGF